jgi:hypothetical protein
MPGSVRRVDAELLALAHSPAPCGIAGTPDLMAGRPDRVDPAGCQHAADQITARGVYRNRR